MQSLKGKEGGGEGVQSSPTDITKSSRPVIKLSPFRDLKNPGKPGLPELSHVPDRLLRGLNAGTVAGSVSISDNVRHEMGEIRRSRMSPEDEKQFYEMIALTRENAIICLDTLSRYDEILSMQQAELLDRVGSMIYSLGGVLKA